MLAVQTPRTVICVSAPLHSCTAMLTGEIFGTFCKSHRMGTVAERSVICPPMVAHFNVNVTELPVTGFVSKVRVPSLPCARNCVPTYSWHGTSLRMPTDDHDTAMLS